MAPLPDAPKDRARLAPVVERLFESKLASLQHAGRLAEYRYLRTLQSALFEGLPISGKPGTGRGPSGWVGGQRPER